MLGRPDLTLLVTVRDLAVRADFRKGTPLVLLGHWRGELHGEETWPEKAAAALRLAPGCGRKIAVLSDAVWTQAVALPQAATQGLDGAQLNTALAFEVEPLSGIPATDAALGYALTGQADGMRSYWISKVQASELVQARERLRKMGGRLVAVAHPGGLPEPVGAEAAHAGGSWGRLEQWPQAVIGLSGTGSGAPSLRVMEAVADRVQTGLARWMAEHRASHYECLGFDAAPADGSVAWKTITLESESVLKLWLAGWGRQIFAADAFVPQIRSPRRPLTSRTMSVMATAGAATMLALCAAHGFWSASQRSNLEAQLNANQNPLKEWKDLSKREKKAREKFDGQRDARIALEEEARKNRALADRKKQRWSTFLAAVRATCPSNAMIRSIASDAKDQIQLEGVCLDLKELEAWRARMELLLNREASVTLSRSEAVNSESGGSLWSFCLTTGWSAEPAADAKSSREPPAKAAQAGRSVPSAARDLAAVEGTVQP